LLVLGGGGAYYAYSQGWIGRSAPTQTPVQWLAAYPIGDCRYAVGIPSGERSTRIAAFGIDEAVFKPMTDAFTKQFGYAPDLAVSTVTPQQCTALGLPEAIAKWLQPGPALALDKVEVASGGIVKGSLTGINGWSSNHLLLVTYLGAVLDLSQFVTAHGDTLSFTLPPLTPDSAKSVPMLVVAISSQQPIAAAKFSDARSALAVFHDIGAEIDATAKPVALSIKSFQLGGRTALGGD
jgi:hypothetical protein